MTGTRSQSAPPQRGILMLTVAMIIALVILLSLGAWQLQRLDEKNAFLAGLAREAKEQPGTNWDAVPDFGRAVLTGEFVAGSQAYVRATLPASSNSGGLGLYVMAALKLPDGRAVLVNRGFIPTGFDGRPPVVALPDGPVRVVGFRRAPEPRQWFAAADEPARRIFAVRDPRVIGPAINIRAEPSFLEAERSGPETRASGTIEPLGVDAAELIGNIPNNHLQYALTWFGIAATLVGVYLAVVLARRRERGAPIGEGPQRL
jgi:surfeit locus 1 family protein